MGIRSIEFRGKRVDNGEWIYGVPFFQENQCYMIEDLFICDEYQCTGATNTEVIPDTIGQYTGLTANGTKIFEGDIVKYGDTVHEVVFEQRNGTAYFGLVYSSIETLSFGHYQDLKQIEVIGNIHDNPELLKGVRE